MLAGAFQACMAQEHMPIGQVQENTGYIRVLKQDDMAHGMDCSSFVWCFQAWLRSPCLKAKCIATQPISKKCREMMWLWHAWFLALALLGCYQEPMPIGQVHLTKCMALACMVPSSSSEESICPSWQAWLMGSQALLDVAHWHLDLAQGDDLLACMVEWKIVGRNAKTTRRNNRGREMERQGEGEREREREREREGGERRSCL